MYPAYLTEEKLHEFIRNAMKEDHGDGDHTSLGSIPEGTQAQGHLLFKQEGIVAGMEMAQIIFDVFPKTYSLSHTKKTGTLFMKERWGLRYLEMPSNYLAQSDWF